MRQIKTLLEIPDAEGGISLFSLLVDNETYIFVLLNHNVKAHKDKNKMKVKCFIVGDVLLFGSITEC